MATFEYPAGVRQAKWVMLVARPCLDFLEKKQTKPINGSATPKYSDSCIGFSLTQLSN